MLQDLRYAVRMLRTGPGFTAVAVLTLALGIGANSAIFSVVSSVLLKPLPYKDPSRLVVIWETDQKNRGALVLPSSANFLDWKDQASVFDQTAGWRFQYFNLTGRDEPERVQGIISSASFLPLLGAKTQLGRTFVSEEERPGHDKVAILSDALWRRRFGADPSLVGQKIQLEGEAYAVVGILAPAFRMIKVLNRPLDVYVPFSFNQARLSREGHDLAVYARLRSGFSLNQAQSEMDVLYRRLAQEFPQTNATRGVQVISLPEAATSGMRPALLLLLSAVGLVLLIACANIANLMLARATARQKEMAVRAALGASRTRLLRQVLTEGLLLALLGGAAGTLLASSIISVLNNVIPDQAVHRLRDFELDRQVAGFTLLISLLSGMISSLVPALRAARLGLSDALKTTGRSSTGTAHARRTNGLLVVAEVALAVALLSGAALLIRSSLRLEGMPRGLDSHNVLTMQTWLARAKYPDSGRVANFYHEVLQRVERLPGVESASAVNFPPLAMQSTPFNFSIEGRSSSPEDQALSGLCSVIGPQYFRTMKIPLRSGREFTDRDNDEARGVVIISESMARRFWPDSNPIGRQIRPRIPEQKSFWIPESKNLPLTIVGVVGDVQVDGIVGRGKLPQFYLPYLQNPSSIMNLVVRTGPNPLRWSGLVRSQVQAVDRDQPVFDIKTMDDVIAETFARPHLLALLLGAFAGVALILAAVGIYGLISYSVSQRTQEIGIRVALGAQPGDVLKLILRQGMSLALIGLGIGLGAALALGGLLKSLLFGVRTTDPATLMAVPLLLVLVALAACYIPARRATKVDPIVALRHE